MDPLSEMKKEEEETVRKQKLLNDEILEKNYDKVEFIKYCMSLKENGDDLSLWDYDELVKVISDFKKTNNPKERTSLDEIIKIDTVEKLEELPNEMEDAKIEKESSTKKSNEIEVSCKTLQKTELSNNMVSITLDNPKEMTQGMFGTSYIIYEVKTEPFGWVVQRRYSDFDTLRNILLKFYPGLNVPPLPGKKIGSRRFDADFIYKRMKFLEVFINQVASNESLKCSEALIAFLQYQDRQKYDTKMKEFSTLQISQYIEELKTLDGKAVLSYNEKNEKYFVNIGRYFALQSQVMDRMNYFLKQFYVSYATAGRAIKEAGRNFRILNVLNSKVLMKPVITKSYEELGVFCENWSKIITKQSELFKEHIKDYYKYMNLEGKSYCALINKRNELKMKYLTEKNRIQMKKEKLFASKDINKFEFSGVPFPIDRIKCINDKEYAFKYICWKDDQNLKLMYEQLGYLNSCNMAELKKLFKKYRVEIISNLKKFDSSFYMSINDMLGTWSNMEQFIITSEMQEK